MRWNIFALNGESNISKRVKNVSYRSLRMESLEKRELLSAAPAERMISAFSMGRGS